MHGNLTECLWIGHKAGRMVHSKKVKAGISRGKNIKKGAFDYLKFYSIFAFLFRKTHLQNL